MSGRTWSLGLAACAICMFASEGLSQTANANRRITHAGFNARTMSNAAPVASPEADTSREGDSGNRGAAWIGDCRDDCGDACGDDCCEESCCPTRTCCPTWRVYGDFLYLRPRSAEVVYAVPFDGPVTPQPAVPIQMGRVALVDPDYDPGFRVGFERVLNECASLGASYTQLDTSSSDSITVDAPLVLRSMVIHPATLDAEADWLDARAFQTINYKLADIEYRRTFLSGCRHSANYLIGASYGHLEQDFRSTFSTLSVDREDVNTDINFDGGGIRLGLEGERMAPCSGWLVYGRANARFLAGEFSARYTQGSTFDPEIVDAQWKAGRIVSLLDLELGVGWASPSGCLRLTGGYMVSGWYNAVTTSDFIGAVQKNDFSGMSDTLTFDGLVVRGEVRF